jgi:hypothetical protein
VKNIAQNPTIQVKESDLNSVQFNFQVTDNGALVDLTGAEVRLVVLKPSGLTVIQDCEMVEAVTGLCRVLLSNQAYLEIGNYTGELVITTPTSTIVTRSFAYSSLDAILDDETLESANDWQAIHDILNNSDKRPILGTGSPNLVVTPEYIGQSYLDTTGMIMYYASTLVNDSWRSFGTGGGGGEIGGSVYWGDVLDKPTSFPPIAHTHLWAEIADRPTTMAPTAHTHLWADITDKPVTFPPSAHTHEEYLTGSQANGLYQAIGTVPTHTHLWADITDKPTTFTPPVMSGGGVGGARVGNGLRMVGEYLTIRDGLGIKANTTTSTLDIDKVATDAWYVRNASGQSLILWKGTQAEYDAIVTKDPNTVYFVT